MDDDVIKLCGWTRVEVPMFEGEIKPLVIPRDEQGQTATQRLQNKILVRDHVRRQAEGYEWLQRAIDKKWPFKKIEDGYAYLHDDILVIFKPEKSETHVVLDAKQRFDELEGTSIDF